MCEFCNGTHVFREQTGAAFIIGPCPICGPEPEEQFQKRMQEFRRRLELLERECANGSPL